MAAVLLRLGVGDERRHVSPLRSVRAMLTRVYPTLDEEEQEEEENKFSSLTAAGLVVALVEPFAAHIHHQFTSGLVSQHIIFSTVLKAVCCAAGSTADLLVTSTERMCWSVSLLQSVPHQSSPLSLSLSLSVFSLCWTSHWSHMTSPGEALRAEQLHRPSW